MKTKAQTFLTKISLCRLLVRFPFKSSVVSSSKMPKLIKMSLLKISNTSSTNFLYIFTLLVITFKNGSVRKELKLFALAAPKT